MKFDVGEHLLFFVSGEPSIGRDGTLIDFFGVVGPIQSYVDIVMGGAGQQSEVHGGFADLLFEIDGTGEGIVDTAGQNPYVVQLLPVVVERRDGRIEVQFLGTAVEITVDVSGFRDLQRDAEIFSIGSVWSMCMYKATSSGVSFLSRGALTKDGI